MSDLDQLRTRYRYQHEKMAKRLKIYKTHRRQRTIRPRGRTYVKLLEVSGYFDV